MDIPPALIDLLHISSHLTALTGAGVSQESGVPTFREAQSGLWSRYRPEDLATPEAFQRDPKLVWDWYAARRGKAASVVPNPGHYALARMGECVPHFTLITQNVDGLHGKAGSREVIELHGNICRVRCFDCATFAEDWQENGIDVPTCEVCGGLLRPDVVWFGELLPSAALEAAFQEAGSCQVFFSIGTSAVVQPAASLALAAREAGAQIVEVNAEMTPLTASANFVLQGRSGEILPELVRQVWNQ